MKKIVAMTLAVVLLLSMAACTKLSVSDKASEAEEVAVNVPDKTTEEEKVTANVETEYCGTWKMDHVVIDGVEYAASELETLNDFRSRAQIVIKDGGKAYVAEGGTNGVIVDWSKTDDGILLDGEDAIMADGLLSLKAYDDEIWYFQKASDSQLIDDLADPDNQETSEDTQDQSIATDNAYNATDPTAPDGEITDVPEETPEGIRPDFKAAMDSYEEFFDDYVAFMKSYMEDPVSMMGEYLSMMQQYTETMAALDAIDDGTLSNEEAIYYAEVTLRINQKLMEIA